MKKVLRQRGVTLIELVMVITIMGVVAAMVAVFMRQPVDAYVDTSLRGALTDVADTTLRRMARDLHKALPNSIRNPNANCIEFIPTRTGSRYRMDDLVPGDGSGLNFGLADSSFNMLGRNADLASDQQIRTGDRIVVYNLGIPGADAYLGDNTSTVMGVIAGATETTLQIGAKQFPFASPNARFHVVPSEESIVSYVCSAGTLYRNANYGYANSCPAPTVGSTPVMARNVASCSFSYGGEDMQRNALVQLTLRFSTPDNEILDLYHEVHVNNTP